MEKIKFKISLGWIISTAGMLLLALMIVLFILNKNAVSKEVTKLEDQITRLQTQLEGKAISQDFELPDQSQILTNLISGLTSQANNQNFISIISPDHNDIITTEPLVFEGAVSDNTEKIVVSALVISNDGVIYNALYTIKDFKLGDKEFTYSAKSEWKNLVKGTNNYQFTAYFKDGTTQSTSATVYYK